MPVAALWNRAAKSKIAVGSHTSANDVHLFVNQMTSAAIHRQSGERTRQKTVGSLRESENRIAARQILINADTRNGEELGKARLQEKPFANRYLRRIKRFGLR